LSNLLITGGAGFIGSHFVDLCVATNSSKITKIIVLDSLNYSGRLQNLQGHISSSAIRFVRGDIIDKHLLEKLVEEERIDSIINFAAESHVDRSIQSGIPFVQSNILGVAVLLEAFKTYCSGVFLQISTDEVYGSINSGSWDEEEPLKPNSPYAASKASADLLVLAYQKTFGIDARITRCSNNYGPRQFPEKLIPLFVTNIILGKKVPLYGDGQNVREWIHVLDHCRAILSVYKDGKCGEVYNVGSGVEVSNLELTRMILENMNIAEDQIEYVEDRKGHDLRYSLDSTKFSREFASNEFQSLEDGLRRTIDWYVENQSWWREVSNKGNL